MEAIGRWGRFLLCLSTRLEREFRWANHRAEIAEMRVRAYEKQLTDAGIQPHTTIVEVTGGEVRMLWNG